MAERTTPSRTQTRKPDEVGKPGSPAVGGGHQTPEQAAITATGADGRSDRDRERAWDAPEGQAGRPPAPTGGASGGHADQKSAENDPGDRTSARADGKVAQGHYEIEKERQ